MPIFNDNIQLRRVTGIDAEIKRKAEELIEVAPDEPRHMREGTMFFCFKDYWLLSHNDGCGHWCIESIDGTQLPEKLQGRFTSRNLAMDAVVRYGDANQQARGRGILERKEIQLQKDIKARTKDNVEHERKKIPTRALKESLARKKRNSDPAAEDKPTIME